MRAFIDFEASSLGRHGYPIEVAWVFEDGNSETFLIAPIEKWTAAGGDAQKLPSLHSPFWAPNAEAVISTATEAMTLAALDVLKKG